MPADLSPLRTFRDGHDLPTPLQPHVKRNAAFELNSAAAYFELRSAAGKDARAGSKRTAAHFDQICNILAGPLYARAFKRWKALWDEEKVQDRARTLEIVASSRVLVGLSNSTLWESSIAIEPTYGVPVLPGSALKGLARHFTESHLCVAGADAETMAKVCDALFGIPGDNGVVEFLDAWWVPETAPSPYAKDRPFVREVVTPHHKEFLDRSGGVPATPFDSPTPIPQLATHGQFLCVAVGSPVWADHALDILRLALEMEGVGARTPEYGRMIAAEG